MRKNMKRKTNVKSSIMVLLLIAILLIASTYAWFTSNRTVTISTLDVNVGASTGIQISVDGISWKTIITNDDILGATTTYSSAVNVIPASLAPVSTDGQYMNNRLRMFFGNVMAATAEQAEASNGAFAEGDYVLTASDESATPQHYVAFDIFLKVDQAETIYLTRTSDVKASGTDKGIKNASRVAFCNLGNVGTDATVEAIQAISSGGTGQQAFIWEPNYDVHTQAGANAASSIYGTTTALTGGSQLPYYALKASITNPVVLNSHDTNYFTSLTSTEVTGSVAGRTDASDLIEVMSLPAGVTKMRVYLWVEGQDVDCENTASGTNLKLDIAFTIDNQ